MKVIRVSNQSPPFQNGESTMLNFLILETKCVKFLTKLGDYENWGLFEQLGSNKANMEKF